MKTLGYHLPVILLFILYSYLSQAQTITINSQVFKIDTLYPSSGTTGLNYPWELTYGPDDSLWVTEARGYKVWKINPVTKGRRSILNVSSDRNFVETSSKWPQGGMMGLAIHPDFNSGKRYVYLAYVYDSIDCPNACYYNTKILRYDYPSSGAGRYTLTNPVVMIDGLPGSNDHNSGRMTIGPVDKKLYYTIGDMGAGQFNNLNRTNHAQDTFTYEGKVLRFNLEPDASQTGGDEWIPDDNPFPARPPATSPNAVFSYGHRNPQGVVFGTVAGNLRLYSSEHGDKSDDEINIIQRKGNYGWPRVAGLSTDNNYSNTDAYTNNNKLAGATLNREDTFYTNNTTRGLLMKEPMKPLFAEPASSIKADNANIFTWWTIAPSSIDFYGTYPKTIPGWDNSILVTSLKYGVYRLKLSVNGDSFVGDTIRYMSNNRVRDVAINPDGDSLYFAIDKSGSTSGPTGGFSGANTATSNPGYILRMVYISTLPFAGKPKPNAVAAEGALVKLYPNPVSSYLYVDCKHGTARPLHVQLIDLAGQTIIEETSDKDSFVMNVQKVKPGVYVFKMIDAKGATISLEKIVIR